MKAILRFGMAILASFLFMQPAMAGKNVNIDVNPSISTGGVNYGVNGVVATYQYTIYDGQSVNDTIPVQICMTGYETGWNSLAITFGNQAGPLPGVTAPSDENFLGNAATPDCRNGQITIASGALNLTNPNLSQNFNANFSLSDDNPNPSGTANKPQAVFADIKNIHIQVTVLPQQGSNVSCFLTDSEGNFLKDCAGTPVTESGSDDGRFAIVANKKQIEVATNPGQFYYNLIWHNTTGAAQTVNVVLARTGLSSKGRQALHAAVFNGYLNPLTQAEFDEANENGIPEGNDDAVNGISVPAGSSLLVTYHLEWTGLGAAVPANCAGTCATANQEAAVTGTVSGTGITTEACTAKAYGYKKQ